MWRFKIASLVVVLLTGAGCGAVLFLVPPIWQLTSSYVLSIPQLPTADQIAVDPKLANVSQKNPYLRFADQSVTINVLARTVNADEVRKVLVDQGADSRYQVVPSAKFGISSPIIDIQIEAATSADAEATAQIVGKAMTKELREIQVSQGADTRYLIDTLPVAQGDVPTTKTSGKLRALIAVGGLGALTLLIMVSSLQAWDRSRQDKAKRRSPSGEYWPTGGGSPELAGYPDGGYGQPAALPSGPRDPGPPPVRRPPERPMQERPAGADQPSPQAPLRPVRRPARPPSTAPNTPNGWPAPAPASGANGAYPAGQRPVTSRPAAPRPAGPHPSSGGTPRQPVQRRQEPGQPGRPEIGRPDQARPEPGRGEPARPEKASGEPRLEPARPDPARPARPGSAD